MFYLPHTPFWLRWLFPSGCIWEMPAAGKTVYLSFDDGPHADATNFVLNELKKFDASATFFCIGKNVKAAPNLYQKILDAGHATGNHTMHHVNGYKTSTDNYVDDYCEAQNFIHSNLFRPPYGRLRRAQIKKLKEKNAAIKIIMWSVLSGDFDESIDGEVCFNYIKKHTRHGSIIVFHDSAKALPRLRYALPLTLAWLQNEGYEFKVLTQ